ncbi:hypothetical protein TSUD_119800 [Trifolium subterraneum]|uniref:Knottin scorpion toxin-like domain-containing protein n=1 Tax=Trifolium subterraneum TaxID=3900 RepID=A0A2Z6N247_TRISU|nr:hypothetical protein TSUD_119800 [Trifolium subterraneum]
MNTTRNIAITMIFLLSFFIFTTDMCMAIEGRGLTGKFPCKSDKDCHCGGGDTGRCLAKQCWCFSPPSSATKHITS